MSINYYVTRNQNGTWNYRREHAKKATGVVDTQAEAEKKAKQIVSNSGGGEVRIQGVDRKFRDSDTVAPGNDPCPPRDKKN